MRIVITGAGGLLGRALVQRLSPRHEVYPSDLRASSEEDLSVVQADVLDIDRMGELCAGMDRMIHLACVPCRSDLSEAENDTRILDTRLKGTYNVMKAALDAGVEQVIQTSDLCIFSGYDADRIISEDFIPRPDTSAHQQSIYLSEWIGREFARLKPGFVLTLRLGELVRRECQAPVVEDCVSRWAWEPSLRPLLLAEGAPSAGLAARREADGSLRLGVLVAR